MERALTAPRAGGALAETFNALENLTEAGSLELTDLSPEARAEVDELVASRNRVPCDGSVDIMSTLLLQNSALEHYCERLLQRIAQYNVDFNRVTCENTQLRLQMDMDSKSQLPNFSGIIHWSKAMSELAIRNKVPIAITFLDFNYFKKINDNYGHEIGDRIIQLTGDYLRQEVSIGEYAGRFGGEEFVLGLYARPLPQHTPAQSVTLGLDRILQGLTPFLRKQLLEREGIDIPFLGFAAGTVCYTPENNELASLIWTPGSVTMAWEPASGEGRRVPHQLDSGKFGKDTLGEHLIKLADMLMYESKMLFRNAFPEMVSERE